MRFGVGKFRKGRLYRPLFLLWGDTVNKKLYLSNGYLDMKYVIETDADFIFVVGARAVGKTYGALEYVIKNDITHILMRRTQAQCDIISKPVFSPYNAINRNLGTEIDLSESISKTSHAINDLSKDPSYRGFTCALSTISNVRGLDVLSHKILIYDEFIPEKHERPIKNEGSAFFNAYETINRNRELDGYPALKCVCLANSNDMGNPIFMHFGIVLTVEKMLANGVEKIVIPERRIAIFCINDSPISKRKKDTALYKAVGKDSEFSRMALSNEFSYDDTSREKSRRLIEYRPFVAVGELCIYKHKSNGLYYVTGHKSGNPKTYGTSSVELARFQIDYRRLWVQYMSNRIEFENYYHELLFQKYFKY